MSRSFWRGSRSSCGLLCAMLILGPVALAACGSIPAPGSSAAADAGGPGAPASAGAVPAGLVLCASPASASRVLIARSASVSRIQPEHVLPPGQAVITAAGRVHSLAKALCALPRMRKGVFRCPALFEGSYRLRFTADGRRLPVVTIQESGCETVTGLGPVRSVSKSPAFWTALAKAVGGLSPLRPVILPLNPGVRVCEPVSDRTLGNTHCPGHATPGKSPHN